MIRENKRILDQINLVEDLQSLKTKSFFSNSLFVVFHKQNTDSK